MGEPGVRDWLLRRNAEVLLVREQIRETGALVQERAESDLAAGLDRGLVIFDIVNVPKAVRSEPGITVVLVHDGGIAARR
jgi:hypothetical protein